MNIQLLQQQFMTACGQYVQMYPSSPEVLSLDDVVLWARLIEEEKQELMLEIAALINCDKDDINKYYEVLANLTAEAADLIYVVCGLSNALGLPLINMFNEIHTANMRKVGDDGKVTKDPYGKVLKPKGWRPANKLRVILEARDYKV